MTMGLSDIEIRRRWRTESVMMVQTPYEDNFTSGPVSLGLRQPNGDSDRSETFGSEKIVMVTLFSFGDFERVKQKVDLIIGGEGQKAEPRFIANAH